MSDPAGTAGKGAAGAGVHVLLFAAGASRRMGGADKLMMDAGGGVPLLRRSARTALDSGLPVAVLLPEGDGPRRAALDGLDLSLIEVPGAAEEGMAASIRAGLGALPPDAVGAMMLMADMPDLTADDLRALAARFSALGGETVVRAAAQDGRPGSPAVVPRRLFAALMALRGDTGGRDVLAAERQELVPLPGERALTDLDTPEAWAAWRAREP